MVLASGVTLSASAHSGVPGTLSNAQSSANLEASTGNHDFVQIKGTLTGGLTQNVAGRLLTERSIIKPEFAQHYERGVKASPLPGASLNFVLQQTAIEGYQAQVRGFEVDARLLVGNFTFQTAHACTDGKYVCFTNATLPLEEVGSRVAFKDVSGGKLPGISRNAVSLGGEYVQPWSLFGRNGEVFVALDSYQRSDFSSSPSPSRSLNVDGYALVNARLGVRVDDHWSGFVWSRNMTDKDYFEQLLPGAANAGHHAAALGDPRT